MAALCLMAALIGADAAPSMSGISPVPVSDVSSLDELSITFTEAVSGVEAGDLLINGAPASGVTGTGCVGIHSGRSDPANHLINSHQCLWTGNETGIP